MDKAKCERIGDTSRLRGSPQAAETYRLTGKFYLDEAPPRPENPTGLYIQDLQGRPILTADIIVPTRDPRGHPSAREFDSWKKALASKIGVPNNTFSIKGHGAVACLSNLERQVLSSLEMNPAVVEIRTQYPEWNFLEIAERRRSNRYYQMREVEMFTVDFIITYQIPGTHELRYHAISCKPLDYLLDDDVVRRHEKEIRYLALWGCTHEIMTEYSISEIEDLNNQRLLQYMLYVENVYHYANHAHALAIALDSLRPDGDYDDVLAWLGNQFDWTRNDAYRYFGIAHFLGYLKFDHSRELLPESPMYERHPELLDIDFREFLPGMGHVA